MKLVYSALTLGLLLGGCSSSGVLGSLGMGSSSPQPAANNIQVNNALAMPPDLQLRPPGTIPEPAHPSNGAGSLSDSGDVSSPEAPSVAKAAAPAAKAPAPDVYAQYGISKVKPDGTAKTEQELQGELKAAVLKKKQETNPNYGTIKNIGNIFSDG